MFSIRLLASGVTLACILALLGCQVKFGPANADGNSNEDTVDPNINPVTKKDKAEEQLSRLNGKVTRDKSLPGTPVVEIRLFNKDTTDGDLKELASFTELRKLDVTGTAITGTGVSHLAGLTKLEDLQMSFAAVNDAGMKEIAKLTSLKVLNVLNTKITDDGVKALAALTDLEDLNIGQNFDVKDVGVYALKDLKKLRRLSVSNSGVSDGAMKAISGLPALRVLELFGSQVTDLGYSYVGKIQSLEELRTSYSITDKGLAELGGLKNLRTLNLWNSRVTIKGVRALPQLKKLKEIDVGSWNITPEEAAKLRDELPNCNVIHKK